MHRAVYIKFAGHSRDGLENAGPRPGARRARYIDPLGSKCVLSSFDSY